MFYVNREVLFYSKGKHTSYASSTNETRGETMEDLSEVNIFFFTIPEDINWN